MRKYLLVALLIAWSNQVFSQDIDLYIKDTSSTVQRQQVLIILDTSSSMGDVLVSDTLANKSRRIIIDLINDNSEIDFALQVFNRNSGSSNDGGRIIAGFKDLSVSGNRTELLNLLDNDTDNTNHNYKKLGDTAFNPVSNPTAPHYVYPYTYTPLCETLYETYSYLSGGAVYYGLENSIDPESILTTAGHYTSPFNSVCNESVNIIYITDGEPTKDTNANGRVKTLTTTTNSDAFVISGTYNFLGVLGEWMAKKNWPTMTDLNATAEGDIAGTVTLYTIGFGSVTGNATAVDLLKLAARHGMPEQKTPGMHTIPAGGGYHEAATATDLELALQNLIETIKDSQTLTSASVSANSLDRTQTLDEVYYGMFEPSTGARWSGNLKKYKIVNGEQVDALGNPAINAAGDFDEDAKSFWSADVDGNDVTKGGVAEMLRTTTTTTTTTINATTKTNRKLLTDIGGSGDLTTFGINEITAKYTTDATLTDQFNIDIGDVADIPSHIQWAMGIDVDNVDTTTTVRPDIFADPLHSKPIVVNYAAHGTRIVVGTNAGVLHMFQDNGSSVTENWAYLPKEFFKNIKPLRENIVAPDNKIYGLDGEITLYIDESDGNGRVDSGDTAWLFFGLRRGGGSYYALDITTPDAPNLMWEITKGGDFSGLGQTWSKPQVVRSAFNTIPGEGNLVLIFGGGYDTAKDAAVLNLSPDDDGAAVYIVNARSGALIVEIPTEGNHGIASSIASLDSDSDSLVDRLYVGDTGGNVWRIDMPDATLTNTSIIALASLGGVTDENDRRFFNQPSIARTYILETTDIGPAGTPNIVQQQIPYDAILLGSGDKATPTKTDTKDMFFMIKDKYIKTQRLDQIVGLDAITLADLSDYTEDPFNGYPTLTPAQEANLLVVSLESGWHFDLKKAGEKTTAEAIVINNTVYFTTYSPAGTTSCAVIPGNGWLYAVDLAFGIKKYNWSADAGNIRGDRIKNMGSQFHGKATLISTLVTTAGVTKLQGNLIIGNTVLPVGFNLGTTKTSLTIAE